MPSLQINRKNINELKKNNMKNVKINLKKLILLGCHALLLPSIVNAGDKATAEEIGAEISIGYDTDYIFRGTNLGPDLLWSDVNVSSSLSEDLDLSIGAWYANVADASGADELDIYAGLSTSFGGMSVDFGSTYYYYPVEGGNTLEIGIGFGTAAGPIDLSAGLYYDIDLENTYFEVGAGTSFEFTDTIAIEIGATVGNNTNLVPDGFTALTIIIGAPIAISDSASLSPYFGINVPIDEYEDIASDDIFSGISLSVGF